MNTRIEDKLKEFGITEDIIVNDDVKEQLTAILSCNGIKAAVFENGSLVIKFEE